MGVPMVAAVVAAVARTRCEAVREPAAPFQLAWAISLAMYAAASLAAVFGVAGGWTTGEFQVYWALGAVLNVPFLAGGRGDAARAQPYRAVRDRIVLVFVTAYTVSVLRGGTFDACRAGQICHRASMSSATGRRPTGCRSWFRSLLPRVARRRSGRPGACGGDAS